MRLYFTSLRGCRFDEDLPAIYSAVSSNGIDYVVEPGRRFGIDGRLVIDCAVALHDGVFHLYSPDNGPQPKAGESPGPVPGQAPNGVGYHATSRDGLAFTRVDDVRVDGRRRWLGNAQSDGTTMTFFGTGDPGGPGPGGPPPEPGQPRGGLWIATSRDGQTWQVTATLPVPGADPGGVAARDGGWIVSVTGPPRPGTPGARGRAGMMPPRDGGPRNHRLVLATSNDGMAWTIGSSREQLLQALVDPSARIAPGFGTISVTLRNGQKVDGILREETEGGLSIEEASGIRRQVANADVTGRVNGASAMPPLGLLLKPSEIRDVVEFLATLR